MKTRKIILSIIATLMLIATVGCSSNNGTTSKVDDQINMTDNTEDILDENDEDVLDNPSFDDEVEIIEEVVGETKYLYEEYGLSVEQWNSVAIMNELLSIVQEIHSFKNNRIFLEETYSKLLSNYKQSRLDTNTANEVLSILDTLEKYKMLDEKRERLNYLYEQNKAKALKNSLPNPVSLVAAVQADNLIKTAGSLLFMAIDSKNRYDNYKDAIELQYLQDGWELNDEEKSNIHTSLKAMFDYTNRMVNEKKLPDELALTLEQVEYFVNIASQSNNTMRIQDLENSQGSFGVLGEYWMVLAECYYNEGEYQKCLDAINSYFALGYDIYKKDCRLSEVLPYAIISASECCNEEEYINLASKYADIIVSTRIEDKFDWSLCYFAAQTYVGLYAQTNEIEYLEKAYSVANASANRLISEQRDMNNTYLKSIDELTLSTKGLKGTEKEEAKKYNEMIKEERKTSLPPVYGPLVLNLEMLRTLSNALEKSDVEKSRLDKLYHDDTIFLNAYLDGVYSFANPTTYYDASDLISFSNKCSEININASALSTNSKVCMKVCISEKETTIDDLTIKEVNRNKNSKDVAEYTATFKSEIAKKLKLSEGDTITIFISTGESDEHPMINSTYKLVKKGLTGWKFEVVK